MPSVTPSHQAPAPMAVAAPEEEPKQVDFTDASWTKQVDIRGSRNGDDSVMIIGLVPGWWFGTWFLFSHILGIIIPIDELIFFRGVQTTNQICLVPTGAVYAAGIRGNDP